MRATKVTEIDALRETAHETRAVEPLDRSPGWDTGGTPETYPFTV
jgi:hypothetical protein